MKPAWNLKITLIVLAILALGGTVLSYIMWADQAYQSGDSLGRIYAPEGPVQPIAFSHRLHAGVRGIKCEYCHTWVRKSDYAGLPTVATCMGCHATIHDLAHESFPGENKEIAKVMAYGQAHKEIPWVRVYQLPDHVHFPHKVHLWALQSHGNPVADTALPGQPGSTALVCAECHGQIWKMDRVYMAVNLIRMGTCLECHAHPPAAATRPGPNDCWECHK